MVLPAFNVEAHLAETVRDLAGRLKEMAGSWEFVVVDDGSSDGTRQVAATLLEEYPGTLLSSSTNSGKGHAVRRGALAARGDEILIIDADSSYGSDHLPGFLEALRSGWDVAIGNRRDPASRYQLHASAFRYLYSRHLIGVGFNWAARRVAGIPYFDTQCGFKAFKQGPATDIFERVRSRGYLYDVEALRIAHILGYRVQSLPVTYHYRGQPSSVRPLFGLVPVLLELLRIRLRHRR